MFSSAVKKVFGSRNQRLLKTIDRMVSSINELELGLEKLSDQNLVAKTAEFRQRFSDGETAEDLLPECFAVVREAAKRTLNMRHFDVQLVGGVVLHQGKIAEMRTGEGKTLVATLPAYLNAICGKTVHVVTVNDYLATRDADWMGKVYQFLGLTVGTIATGQTQESKKAAYNCDIVYGTNNEYGFDYLRDNMAFSNDDKVQRKLDFSIIDEVDSILVDEARTPLIISGPAEDSTELYIRINKLIPHFVRQDIEDGDGHFSLDEKSRQVFLTEEGHDRAEELLMKAGLLPEGTGLYDASNIILLHHLFAGLRAHSLFQRDVDYIVRDDQVVIIDEFTGRMMAGRRWSEGLHQAVEAKEGVKIQQENQTLASITFQNLFRLYGKFSGMTGTADTEATEFQEIYDLEVVVIPTHKTMIREDRSDLVYRTEKEKFAAIVGGIQECGGRDQPVLVGTASIETSEALSKYLKNQGIQHEVLNAKHHEQEASIIAQAGRPGAVTIATNMAGRGTDIVLGGNIDIELSQKGDISPVEETAMRQSWKERHDVVLRAGGLHVLGTERHESRRVDNQLRGRCGRQGDPGSSAFYVSMEDGLMRIFGSEKVAGLMEKLGMEDGEAIEHPWVTRAIENAQKKVEGRNFDVRKQLLEYDNVANEQRKIIYDERNTLMASDDISETIVSTRTSVVEAVIDRYVVPQSLSEQWDIDGLEKGIADEFGIEMPVGTWLENDTELHEEGLRHKIESKIDQDYKNKIEAVGEPTVRHVEKAVMLKVLDEQWKEHLSNMDHLRQGIGLRGYAQKNPKQEYKREAFEMFTAMLDRVKHDAVTILAKIQVQTENELASLTQSQSKQGDESHEYLHPEMSLPSHTNPGSSTGQIDESNRVGAEFPSKNGERPSNPQPFVRVSPKVGRNEPCPCGSGKKYKQCHGKL
ncbi:MAG: preprotein translocase subunit SecA [Acidiferrobacteraceae bacterium]|nr:preprotein translocase subunit SecA [Acidiferrobacteraceae bacterium]|tara:strand:+ start:31900 stop:34665 length:2766 start_codon:yes stop_codon:yes gene_type:complete